jgi:hypothetical protein
MKDFLQALQDAFPALKTHPVLMARLFVAAIVLTGFWAAKRLRRTIFWTLCTKMHDRVAVTSRWLFVFHNGDVTKNWKYYTSEVTGKGDTGDDIIWTLVRWPSFKPIDSFKLVGAVGMDHALHESSAKLEGRWKIIHDPYASIGPLPARGPISKLRRVCARVLLALSGGPASANKIENSAITVQ